MFRHPTPVECTTSHRILVTEGGFVQPMLPLSGPLICFIHIFQWVVTLKGLLLRTHVPGAGIELLQQHTIFLDVISSARMVGFNHPIRHEHEVEKQSVLVFGQVDIHVRRYSQLDPVVGPGRHTVSARNGTVAQSSARIQQRCPGQHKLLDSSYPAQRS